MRRVMVTGAAGFIGFNLAKRLLELGDDVLGIDNMNDYYDVALKKARLQQLEARQAFEFRKVALEDGDSMMQAFEAYRPEVVVNLAAQAGVRYSLVNPHAYVDSNLAGFVNVLEGCRHHDVKHLVFASSSSVYGANTKLPFSTRDNVDHPVSLYAATKKANELMSHTYSHLYGLPTTGLRFFTVYGPWGRPDMALFLFTKAILAGKPIQVFNHGDMKRDFTYVDDVAEGIVRVMDRVPTGDPTWSGDDPEPGASYAPYRVYNIGNNAPVDLMHMIRVLEDCLGKTAEKKFVPMQPGDVPMTYADVTDLIRDTGFKPDTTIEVGVQKFVEWYRTYHATRPSD